MTTELFDPTTYKVNYPNQDGHDVEQVTVTVGGTSPLDRNNQNHMDWATSLTLGKTLLLTDQDGNRFYLYVSKKPASLKRSDDGHEHVNQQITLTLEAITIDT